MGKGRLSKTWFFFLLVLGVCVGAYLVLIPDISRLKPNNPRKTAFMEYRQKEWKKKGRKVLQSLPDAVFGKSVR